MCCFRLKEKEARSATVRRKYKECKARVKYMGNMIVSAERAQRAIRDAHRAAAARSESPPPDSAHPPQHCLPGPHPGETPGTCLQLTHMCPELARSRVVARREDAVPATAALLVD